MNPAPGVLSLRRTEDLSDPCMIAHTTLGVSLRRKEILMSDTRDSRSLRSKVLDAYQAILETYPEGPLLKT